MEPPRPEQSSLSFGATVTIVTGMVVGVVGLSVLVSLVGGMWLDRVLGTRPAFTVGLIVIAGPFSLYLIYRLTIRVLGRMKPAAPIQMGKSVRSYDEGGDNE